MAFMKRRGKKPCALNLKVGSAVSNYDEELEPLEEKPKIVKILPKLHLSSEKGARDLDELKRHSVSHIMNVTHDHPNVFEGQFEYLRIAVEDNWSTDLLGVFDEAINFIDEGIQNGTDVLVHCHSCNCLLDEDSTVESRSTLAKWIHSFLGILRNS